MDLEVRKIRPEEVIETEKLFSVAFEFPLDQKTSQIRTKEDAVQYFEEKSKNPKAREDENLLYRYGAFDKNKMTACIYLTDFQMQFYGHHVKTAGVGGVSSLPQYRRRGGIRGCFEKLLPDLYEEKTILAYLYPFSTAYYRKFGFEQAVTGSGYRVKLEYLPKFDLGGFAELVDGNNKDQVLGGIKALDVKWQERYNCMVIRGDWEYQFVKKADPYHASDQQEFLYVAYNEKSEMIGYMTFHKSVVSGVVGTTAVRSQEIVVTRFVFDGSDGCKRLLSILKTMAADHEGAVLTLPEDCRLERVLPELSFGALEKQGKWLGMARLVRVKDALEKACYRGSGIVRFAVKDEQIPKNNGIYEVRYRDGRATFVDHRGMENELENMPVFKIHELTSAMLLGFSGFPGDLPSDKEKVASVFDVRPCYLEEYF